MISEENNNLKPLGIVVVRTIIDHKRKLVILLSVAIISAIVFTSPLFIDPVYKSETIIYPPTTNTSTNLLNSDMRFGGESDINTEIQVLQSSILRDSLIRKYNLLKHYKIDTTSPTRNNKLYKTYNDNIKIERSRYNSIDIDVYDTDPEIAASIANDIVKIGDNVKSEILKKNLRNAYAFILREYNSKIKEISDLGDSINFYRHKNYHDATTLQNNQYFAQKGTVDNLRNSIVKIRNEEGIYNLDNQFNDIYKSYLNANATYLIDSGMVAVMRKHFKTDDTALVKREAELEGSRMLSNKLKDKLEKLNVSGKTYNAIFDNYNFEKNILGELKSEYEKSTSTFDKEFGNLRLETLKNKYNAELLLYNNLKSRYELALSNLTDQVPASYIISPAEVPTKKDSPNRLLITCLVGACVLVLFILFSMGAGFFQRIYSEIKG